MSSVRLDGSILYNWKMLSIPFHNFNEAQRFNPIIQAANSAFIEIFDRKYPKDNLGMFSLPTFKYISFNYSKT